MSKDIYQIVEEVNKGGVGNANTVIQVDLPMKLIYIISILTICSYLIISYIEKEGHNQIIQSTQVLSKIDMYKIDRDLKQYIPTYSVNDTEARDTAKRKGLLYLEKTLNALTKRYSSNMVYVQQHKDSSVKNLLELNIKIKKIKSEILFKLDKTLESKGQ